MISCIVVKLYEIPNQISSVCKLFITLKRVMSVFIICYKNI